MEFEKVVKQKTDEIVEKIRNNLKKVGQEFTERDELMVRVGVSNAFPIISIALSSTDPNIVLKDENTENIVDNKCPRCNSNQFNKDESMTLNTNPPKYLYICNLCGYEDYRNY